MKKNIILTFGILIIVSFLVSNVSALNATVCCEKTLSGLFCQNVPSDQCSSDSRQAPTSCDSTSYCKGGTCYNSNQGTCLDNTPQIVCNANSGTWSEKSPPQCNLGCCILGDQAAFVTLVRCKYLSASLGLLTDYNSNINNEVECVMQVQNQDTGACVFDSDFERTCKFTTRGQCSIGFNGTNVKGEFFKDKLCSAPELGTNCAPTKNTLCVPGKDEVYFVDSCGNPANIYDASKLQDQDYWTNVKTKEQSCNSANGNPVSQSCGNCNYLLGSICRPTTDSGVKPNYGDNICTDLNCKTTANGQSYKHGESWCVYDDKGTAGQGNNAVGSQYFKHICEDGQEVLEACADYRAQECIQDTIKTASGTTFSQAACRVNRWIDCLAQTNKQDCENSDKRDCIWNPSLDGVNNSISNGACIPKVTPGLQFWTGDQSTAICAQANAECTVTFEKGLFGGASCKSNCDCLTTSWAKKKSDLCTAIGDCGAKINWIGDTGYKPGYNVTIS